MSTGLLTVRIRKDSIVFNMRKALNYASDQDHRACFWVEDYTSLYEEFLKVSVVGKDMLESEQNGEIDLAETFEELNELEALEQEEPAPELKPLPGHLRYNFLDSTDRYPVIVAAGLTHFQVDQLLGVLMEFKQAIG